VIRRCFRRRSKPSDHGAPTWAQSQLVRSPGHCDSRRCFGRQRPHVETARRETAMSNGSASHSTPRTASDWPCAAPRGENANSFAHLAMRPLRNWLGRPRPHVERAPGENRFVVLARAARSATALATPPAKMHEVVLAPPACLFSYVGSRTRYAAPVRGSVSSKTDRRAEPRRRRRPRRWGEISPGYLLVHMTIVA
jgi:hypothetical protein